jgi:glycosyltransferase involved in cell wall biosynthesis
MPLVFLCVQCGLLSAAIWLTMSNTKRWLFYRHYPFHTGGHQKVADYFSHVAQVPHFFAAIHFSAESLFPAGNPWHAMGAVQSVDYVPSGYDFIFLAGMDWQAYLPYKHLRKPVINLIQHVRHSDPAQPMYAFLSEPAIRICVSDQVAEAILATGRVNGPVYVIPNGLDLPLLEPVPKSIDALVLSLKQPHLGAQIVKVLVAKGFNVRVVDELIPRLELLQLMNATKLGITLPHDTEGFYLPALEAMQYCDVAVVPDCVGNRSFCVDRVNCFVPAQLNEQDILSAIDNALAMTSEVASALRNNALDTVKRHSLAVERASFLAIAARIDELWQAALSEGRLHFS